MKNFFYLFLFVGFITACSSGPEDSGIYTIEQFVKNEDVIGGNFAYNEKSLLITSNQTGIYNTYALPIDGTAPSMLTRSETESCTGVSYFPNDFRILFTKDNNGKENSHLYVRNSKGREKDLTPGSEVKGQFLTWARDGQSFFYLSNARDASKLDLYQMPIEEVEKYKPASEIVFQNNAGLKIACISHDQKFLALVKPHTTNNADMFLYNIEEKKLTMLTKHIGDAIYQPQFFNLNNHDLYYLSNENSEFTYLAKFNVLTKEKNIVFQPNWDVISANMSFNEKYHIVRVNEDSKYGVHVFNAKNYKEVALPTIEGASIVDANVSKSEKYLSLTVDKSTSPRNIYLYSFADNHLKRLTNTLNPEIKEENLVAGKVVRYRSFDNKDIPAIYYQPKTATAKKPAPAIIFAHEGLGAQTMLTYSALFQYLTNNGYAILAINNRGSGGYGKTFLKLDDNTHGDGDLKDCVAGKKYLASLGVIDMDRVAIMGTVYGGYLSLAALTFAPDEFNVGINMFGYCNIKSSLQDIPPAYKFNRDALYAVIGDPYTEDSVKLKKISPYYSANKITKPLMVLQGANDVLIKQKEFKEMVKTVKSNGVPVEYLLFEDEGQGFRKNQNEIKAYGQVKTFLDTHLVSKKKSSDS